MRIAWVTVLVSMISLDLAAQPDSRPIPSARSRADVCPEPCRVLQRMRVGNARVQVLEQGRRETTVYLWVRRGNHAWAETLGGNGPAFGSEVGVGYSFDRLERADADGDPTTHEVVALAAGPDASATFCQITPTPCCAFSVVATRSPSGSVRPPVLSSPIRYCP